MDKKYELLKTFQTAAVPEIDYVFVKQALKDYAHPRDKMTSLLKSHVLIRVKKGLYAVNPELGKQPYSKETLANLIYGPSYISLEYALAFYGLIPERVEVVTSVTTKRNKIFDTPLGRFTYRHLNSAKFWTGMTQQSLDSTHAVLMATPEKALADLMTLSAAKPDLRNVAAVEAYLVQDMRLEPESLSKLDTTHMEQISLIMRNRNVYFLFRYLQQRKQTQ